MPSERKSDTKLAEATARTAGVLQTLQARLNREAVASVEESPEELGTQLQEYFATSAKADLSAGRVSGDIRELVIEGVVDRILRSWEEPNAGLLVLKSEVIARLVERVLREFSPNAAPANKTR